ncbi:MAG: EVE domain-containing protein [Geminicoccaceae bacterium]|nr:EVE domain-containing protein [Geminicoccaceae bacterium]
MNRWLLKAEPADYAWERFVADGQTAWTGVRNHEAAANLRAMAAGDPAFFYRSLKAPAIVGTMRITRAAYPDPTAEDLRWVCVDAVPMAPLPRPLTLAAIKADPRFADLALVRRSRLSVVPVGEGHWRALCEMAGG